METEQQNIGKNQEKDRLTTINTNFNENETIPANDTSGKMVDPDKNSFFEKIQSRAGALFEKHGISFKRGRGRPKKNGTPKANDIPLEQNRQTSIPIPQTQTLTNSVENFDSNLVARCVSAVCKAFKGFADAKLFSAAVKATKDTKFARDLVNETTVTDEEIGALGELTEICLRKYGVGTEYCPEIGLVCIVTGSVIRYQSALKSLEIKTEKPLDKP